MIVKVMVTVIAEKNEILIEAKIGTGEIAGIKTMTVIERIVIAIGTQIETEIEIGIEIAKRIQRKAKIVVKMETVSKHRHLKSRKQTPQLSMKENPIILMERLPSRTKIWRK